MTGLRVFHTNMPNARQITFSSYVHMLHTCIWVAVKIMVPFWIPIIIIIIIIIIRIIIIIIIIWLLICRVPPQKRSSF